MDNVLYRTVVGSRLYGLAHAESDWDWYTVLEPVKKRTASYATHQIVGAQDSIVVDWGTWMQHLHKGVPQAYEAMFSTMAEVNRIPSFTASFRAGTNYGAYRRVMRKMAEQFDDFKHKRHMVRLAFNVADLRRYGKFNPTLSPKEITLVNLAAHTMSMAEVKKLAEEVAWAEYVC